MDIILIPGLWLDGSSWEKVVPVLEQAGHRTHPLTLPGMESQDADRSGITLRDHVDAVIAAIDSVDLADGKVVLVGHSAGAALAHAAVDARPDRVARVVYVGGFPTGDGDAIADGYPAENGEVPLPDWSAFADEDLADLDWDWHSAAEDTPEQLFALWQEAVARSRSLVAEALADGGLERLARRTWPDGRAPSLRWILVHLIEEYARHNGHADLLRESVDGLTGE
jgi:pimeloyl-ACP methyl ester carboxylesterase